MCGSLLLSGFQSIFLLCCFEAIAVLQNQALLSNLAGVRSPPQGRSPSLFFN
ncbi:MAG: hypothetical protein V7K98_10100 [Nostoc sp.]|uniref:hypothetical protein n=1 Tax=Nostoc sp. TaxID=1180 RepID=UPI002FFAC19C